MPTIFETDEERERQRRWLSDHPRLRQMLDRIQPFPLWVVIGLLLLAAFLRVTLNL